MMREGMAHDISSSEEEKSPQRLASRLSALGAGLALGIGTLALFTYVRSGYSAQVRLFPYSPAMKPNTALCLALLGMAAFGLRGRVPLRQRAIGSLVLATAAGAISLLTLGEHLFDLDLGLDAIVLSMPLARMSPITACVLASLATVLSLSALSIRAVFLCQSLLALTGLLSLLPIMGYLYQAPFFYDVGALTAVAPGMAVGGLGLMMATFALRSDEGLWPLLVGDTAGSSLLRRVLPAVVALPMFFGWMRLEAERHGNIGLELGVALIAAATVLTFAGLLVWSARGLRDQDLARRSALVNLREAHHNLEARVEERTRALTEVEVELRRANSRLLLAKEAAERAMRARADFLARMSHEMRTPLNGVVGMLEIALRSDLTASQRGYVQTAQSSADALLGLIRDVLDFSKIDAGKLILESTTFRLRDCMALSLRDSAAAAQSKGLGLFLSVASDIPECMTGDAQRIRQVLTNLVSNAVKFTERGEVRVSVARAWRKHEEIGLRIEVLDTGVGIPQNKQAEIFQAFTQADETTTRRFGGTGLGLAISAQLVQLMGGEIHVESEPGQGARFFFTIDLAIDHEAEIELDRSRAALAGLRALVVERHAQHREYLVDLLERWGIEAVHVAPGAALGLALDARDAGSPFALLLLDELDAASKGEPYLRSLRAALGAAFPLVLSTLAGVPDDARELRLKHCSSQLTKPFVASELFETIVGLLAEPRELPERLRPSDSAPLHVLVVEDNAVNRRVACFLLESAGYRVVSAEDGREALAALAQRNFDVVLMDGHMPELDGIEATREIRIRERGTGRHTPIIALTAQAMKGDRERYLGAGMDGYLTKPFQSAQLFAAIRQVVGRAPEAPSASEKSIQRKASRVTETPVTKAPVERPNVVGTGPLTSVYERDQLLSRLRGAERVLRQMVQIFDEEAPGLLAALKVQIEAKNVLRVQQAAHKLSGSLLTVGGTRAAQSAHAIEAYAREGVLTDAVALHAQLSRELVALKQAMLLEGDLTDPKDGS